MQWRDDREGKFRSGFMVPFASSQTLQVLFPANSIFSSFPSSSEGGHQSAGFLYGSRRRIFGFRFLRTFIIDVNDIHLNE